MNLSKNCVFCIFLAANVCIDPLRTLRGADLGEKNTLVYWGALQGGLSYYSCLITSLSP